MIRFCHILLLMILGTSLSMAHLHGKDEKDREKMFEQVQEFKMKYLAQEMNLQGDQKKEFFKVYGEMDKEKRECFKKAIDMERKVKADKGATEADYQKVREAVTQAKAKSAEIDQKYDEKFAEFLSEKQIYKMKEAEKEFRKKMEEMRHNNKHGKKEKSK